MSLRKKLLETLKHHRWKTGLLNRYDCVHILANFDYQAETIGKKKAFQTAKENIESEINQRTK